jgi:hypothetical protein
MRRVTREEAEAWTALARQYGFINADGDIALGRYVLERDDNGQTWVRFITPVVASFHTERDARPKTPPILFERTDAGEIILPGRWWQRAFESVAADETVPADVRRIATVAARSVLVSDCLVPATVETISFLAPNDVGELVVHEALPPGTRVPLMMQQH